MAIKSELIYKGLIAPAAYTRVRAVNVDAGGTEIKVTVTLQDFVSKEDAEKVLEDVKRLATFEEIEATPELKAQADEQRAAEVAKYEANDNLAQWEDVASKSWEPTIVLTEQKWLGKRAGEPLQERSVELTLDEAVAILTMSVPGQPPEDVPDNLTSQIYRALMSSGRFAKAEVI